MVCSGTRDDWVVIGGKGKPRKLQTKSSTPEQQRSSDAGQPGSSTPAAAAPAAADLHTLLPNWEAPAASNDQPSETCSTASRHSSRRAARGPVSREQRLQQLLQQVDAMVQELSAAPVFKALVAALQALPPGSSDNAACTAQSSCFKEGETPQTAPGVPTTFCRQSPGAPTAEQSEVCIGSSSMACTEQNQQTACSSSQPPSAALEPGHRCSTSGSCSSSSSTGTAMSPTWAWSSIQQLVVYGLGSCEHSRTSCYQLAMARLLQSLLPGLTRPPQLFDPAFTPLDQALLQQLGWQVISEDEGGGRAVSVPTFFFLPHCEVALCERLLEVNWNPQQLPLVNIWGNAFSSYQDRWALSAASRPGRPGRLLLLSEQGHVCERAIPDHQFHIASAFNDMALHTFPPGSLAGLDCSA